jgi:uncharacterized protein (TIGR04255 family)
VAKLNNPPVVEVLLAVEFVPSTDKSNAWSKELAERYFEEYTDEFTEFELQHSQSVQVEHSKNCLPKVHVPKPVLERVRAFDKSRTRGLQIAHNRIVYNSLTPGLGYPGYETLYAEAAKRFSRFLSVFRPQSILSASICYVDVINIPLNNRTSLNIEDYFKIGRDMADSPFGSTVRYNAEFVLDCPDDKGPATLRLHSLPPEGGFFPFCMVSHKQCVGFEGLNLEAVRSRLRTSKEYLTKCFQSSVTDECWNLFEPTE